MKKVFVFLVFCTAMLWSYSATAQTSSAGALAGYAEVTLSYTWVNCSNSGAIDVTFFWYNPNWVVPNKTESARKYYSANSEGDTFYFSMINHGPFVTKTRTAVQSFDAPVNIVEQPGNVQNHIVAPNPCQASNGCKRVGNGVISCPSGGGHTD
ncbi:MAG: hypothetical protein FWF09_02185 [Bacteroidales bacterium]|nr:hypothetical protein [Bacteroidales bacterium]